MKNQTKLIGLISLMVLLFGCAKNGPLAPNVTNFSRSSMCSDTGLIDNFENDQTFASQPGQRDAAWFSCAPNGVYTFTMDENKNGDSSTFLHVAFNKPAGEEWSFIGAGVDGTGKFNDFSRVLSVSISAFTTTPNLSILLKFEDGSFRQSGDVSIQSVAANGKFNVLSWNLSGMNWGTCDRSHIRTIFFFIQPGQTGSGSLDLDNLKATVSAPTPGATISYVCNHALYLINSDGSNARKIVTGDVYSGARNYRGGQTLVFSGASIAGDSNGYVSRLFYECNLDGSNLHAVAGNVSGVFAAVKALSMDGVDWSWSGDKIFGSPAQQTFVYNYYNNYIVSSLYKSNPDGSDALECLRHITDNPGSMPDYSYIYYVCSTPDHRVIYRQQNRPFEYGTAQPNANFIVNADGTNPIQLPGPADAVVSDCAQDMTLVLEMNNTIQTMNINGGGLQQIIANGTQPHFSADGQRIVYISDQDGQTDIYTADRNGGNVTRVTNNADSESDPRFIF